MPGDKLEECIILEAVSISLICGNKAINYALTDNKRGFERLSEADNNLPYLLRPPCVLNPSGDIELFR